MKAFEKHEHLSPLLRASSVVEDDREGDLRLHCQTTGRSCQLNPTARLIWELCDGQRSIVDIHDVIAAHLDTATPGLMDGVEQTVKTLMEMALLSIETNGASSSDSLPAGQTRSKTDPSEPMEPVRVFVGTDYRQRRVELTLEHSIKKYTTGPVEIVWMDSARGGLWDGWDMGRAAGDLTEGHNKGWQTEFSCFRVAVPEAAGFEGRALYFDSDMLVLRDLRELFEQEMEGAWLMTTNCPATMLFDCGYFKDKSWWPRIDEMKSNGWHIEAYVSLVGADSQLGELDNRWNCHDGDGFVPGETGVIHFTRRATQPWMPYPEVFTYSPHPDETMEALWWTHYLEARQLASSTKLPSVRIPLIKASIPPIHRIWEDMTHRPPAARRTMRTEQVTRISKPGASEFQEIIQPCLRPVLIEGGVRGWPALERWNSEYLKKAAGSQTVNCMVIPDGVPDGYFSLGRWKSSPTLERRYGQVTVADFIDRVWMTDRPRSYLRSHNPDLFDALAEDIPTPTFLDATKVITQSIWMGASNTVATPHYDPLNIVHALVTGRKRFLLFDRADLWRLYPHGVLSGYFPHTSRIRDVDHVDTRHFPRFRKATAYECVLAPGDALFIPIGWWHQVNTLEPSAGVSFAWQWSLNALDPIVLRDRGFQLYRKMIAAWRNRRMVI